MTPITLSEQVAEVRREIAMRQAVYPGLVERKKLAPARADRQLAVMRAVLEKLLQLEHGEVT